MKEIAEIVREISRPEHKNKTFGLATLVHTQGSTYRRPGARLLITPDGRRIGSLSGGCLESDVAAHAQKIDADGAARLVCYDARSVFGYAHESGCNGALEILIERVMPDNLALRFLADCLTQRRAGVLATIFRTNGTGNVFVGQQCAFTSDGAAFSTVNGVLESVIADDVQTVLLTGQSLVKSYEIMNCVVEVLLESIVPPPALFVCGAGPEAVPLMNYAASLGWQITVADYRPALLASDRFPHAAELLTLNPDCPEAVLKPDNRTAAVIMTHNYACDLALLRTLLPSPAQYIGLLGPHRRAEQLLNELHETGAELHPAYLERLYSPAGLDIGSETPDEIALSIVAEIQAAFAGRKSGNLRERCAPIHNALLSTQTISSPDAEVPVCALSLS